MIITPYLNRKITRPLKWILALIFLYLIYICLFSNNSKPPKPRKKPKLVENYTCPFARTEGTASENLFFHTNNGTDARILVILDSLFSRHGKTIIQILNSQKLQFKAEAVSKNLPVLTTSRRGRYSLIIIENYYKYLNMAQWNRQLLDKYCKEYRVPMFSFMSSKPNDQLKRIKIKVRFSGFTKVCKLDLILLKQFHILVFFREVHFGCGKINEFNDSPSLHP